MDGLRPAPEIGDHPLDQLAYCLAAGRGGARTAIVTIVGVVERASRNLGAHMIVREDGAYAGSVSSGCVDANVAAVALEALAAREARRLKLGAGSGFIDIKLPCGGGVDLLIVPDPDPGALEDAHRRLRRRRPAALAFSTEGVEVRRDAGPVTNWVGDRFVRAYRPRLRLALAGRGPELTAFCRIACAAGFEVAAFSPDAADVGHCRSLGAEAGALSSPEAGAELGLDPWSALVLLFHDHDWEPALIERGLDSPAFYIGALGSRRTQAARLEMLLARGTPVEDLERVRGPIGLVPSMRDASMLALSALAEIIDVFQGAARG